MSNPSELDHLLAQLRGLEERSKAMSIDIQRLSFEISRLRNEKGNVPPAPPVTRTTVQSSEKPPEIIVPREQPAPPSVHFPKLPGVKSDLEKFIGENLINKIGILITVIGVAFGARYAIDHQLISPLTRIILGYLVGMGLLGFAFKLKSKYKNYSAVLLGGAMAIFYFLTFAAYNFYDLLPQTVAFGLMVVFTCFTVFAAIMYDIPLIAHLGLVGAYGVPFLLSDGSGRVGVLFTYMSILNTGILVLAFRKYWKSLYYSAFALTWLIYEAWCIGDNGYETHFTISLVFLTVFFTIFYITLMAYKSLRKEELEKVDVMMLLGNSFLFYITGYTILQEHPVGKELLGLFTLLNGVIHVGVAVMVHRLQLLNRNLFYLILGVALTFLTITVPVQLDGHFVTLLWTGEALLLFWIARKRKVAVYEQLSYIMMGLSIISMLEDWSDYSNPLMGLQNSITFTPVLNPNFLTSLMFAAAFGFITWINRQEKYPSTLAADTPWPKLITVVAPVVMITGIFIGCRLEIVNLFSTAFKQSAIVVPSDGDSYSIYNDDISRFQNIWLVNYSLIFFVLLAWIDMLRFRERKLGIAAMLIIGVSLFLFLVQGLYELSLLRESYITPKPEYITSWFHIGIRYVCYALVAVSLWTCHRYRSAPHLKDFVPDEVFDTLLHITGVWLLSSELINLMDLGHSQQSYRFGLSILWGVYSFALIALGIWRRKKHLRILAIVLFGITLVKLFVYDISELSTIAKTIAFVSLGVLLLVISFLYNKYKQYLNNDIQP